MTEGVFYIVENICLEGIWNINNFLLLLKQKRVMFLMKYINGYHRVVQVIYTMSYKVSGDSFVLAVTKTNLL